jgi:cytochrome c-type biogenesis protein CcmF
MLSIIGTGLVGLGFVSAIYAVICYGILLKTKAEHWGKIAKLSLYISIILHFTALVLLIWAFITNQFQLQYVAQHSNKAMPFFLNI